MKTALLLSCLSLGLAACSVSVRPTPATVAVNRAPELIQRFQPVRGEGSRYFVGEDVAFRITTRTAGYLTLVSLDPDGYGNVLARNVYIPAGTTVLPRPSDNVALTLTPPRGLQRVRAIFTTARPSGTIVFGGRYDANGWNTYTDAYASDFGPGRRDVEETFFYIR